MSLAGTYNVIIDQGSTYVLPIIVSSSTNFRDLTGYTARSQVRTSYSATSAIATFAVSGAAYNSGSFSLILTATQTAAMPAVTGVYDVEIYSGSYVERILQGTATVLPEVTKN